MEAYEFSLDRCTGFDAMLGSRTERYGSVVELQATTFVVL
jgi:hypothetical protein